MQFMIDTRCMDHAVYDFATNFIIHLTVSKLKTRLIQEVVF